MGPIRRVRLSMVLSVRPLRPWMAYPSLVPARVSEPAYPCRARFIAAAHGQLILYRIYLGKKIMREKIGPGIQAH